jgi:hypothetical protein
VPQIEFKKTGALRTASVDGKELNFNNNGTAVRNLVAGEYAVHWFARGDAGSEYTLTVGRRGQKPIKEKRGTVDASRKDAGTLWIEVP